MRLDFLVKLKYQSSTIILLSVGNKYFIRDLYSVTSLTTNDVQSSDMRHIRQMMSALPLASARLSKL